MEYTINRISRNLQNIMHPKPAVSAVQNLSLEKPKKKSGKVFGHSRTLSRVEDLGVMVVELLTSSHVVL